MSVLIGKFSGIRDQISNRVRAVYYEYQSCSWENLCITRIRKAYIVGVAKPQLAEFYSSIVFNSEH